MFQQSEQFPTLEWWNLYWNLTHLLQNYPIQTALTYLSTSYQFSIRGINMIFFSMALPAHSEPRPLIQFRNHFSQTVGLLGWVISPSEGRYLNTGQHKHTINAYTPNIRTHDPSIRASEDSSCLKPAAIVKTIPITGQGDPQDCETLRFLHFLDNRLTDGGKVVSLTRRPPFTSRKISGTHFC
jgi:hypothetical protein